MEYGYINLNFNDNLKLKQIPNNAIVDMLYNIENRILKIYSS